MSSQFPESVDTLARAVNGTTKVKAETVNPIMDATEATQTALGESGKSQAWNIDVLKFLAGQAPRMVVSYVDAETIEIGVGVVLCENSGKSIRVLRENGSAFQITGAELDTGAGSLDPDETYYAYAIADSAATSITGKISLSATTPASSTLFRRIARFETDDAGDIIEQSIVNERDDLVNMANVLEIVIGTYTGNGVDNRDIKIGFADPSKTPKFVEVWAAPGGGGGHLMYNGMSNGISPLDGSSQTSGIKSLAADSFRVGTNAQANQNGTTFYYKAGA